MGNIRKLTSRDNPFIKALRALAADPREIRRQERTLLDGPHLVEAYLDRRGLPDSVVVSESAAASAEVEGLLARMGDVDTVHVPDGVFREVSGGGTPVGILAVVRIPATPAGAIEGSCVMLDAIQDAGNVGTMLRTAAAAGIRDAVLGRGCAGAWAPRVLRAGQGAHFALRIREQADLAEELARYRGTSIAAVARGGESLYELDIAGPVAWIFGNEGAGIDERLIAAATRRATIPLSGETESLNVAAAAAICLFEGVRQARRRERKAK